LTSKLSERDLNSRKDLKREERLRSPPKQLCVVLPVWGARYVNLFLSYSLPTLLAPGNVPALSAQLPCRFVVMTSAADLTLFEDHPAWRRLQSLCAVDFRLIDDLITGSNYSTTITLAYLRVVVQTGDAMCDTCFFFLVSDYIVADGSFAAVLARMKAGASGVQAANMQTVNDALERLFSSCSRDTGISLPKRGLAAAAAAPSKASGMRRDLDPRYPDFALDPENPVAVFRPRELVSLALERLHPATIANMVDFPACHNAHTNRLFWRADPRTVIGRFYLMHMICIRPETSDFTIGSSCDYSFIPEMCASGNVDVMTDSDKYLVLEFQPLDHESSFLRAGPLTPEILATSLNEWATAHHRDNARHSIIYHADDIAPSVSRAIEAADAFVAQVGRSLRAEPVPHRDHPYWRGAIAAHRFATGEPPTAADRAALVGMRQNESRGPLGDLLQRFQQWLVGLPFDCRPWQPRWLDFADVMARLRSVLDPSKQLLVASGHPLDLIDWTCRLGIPAQTCDLDFLTTPNDAHRRRNAGRFDVALLILGEDDLQRSAPLPRGLLTVMRPQAAILAVIVNARRSNRREFNYSIGTGISRLFDVRFAVTAIRYVAASRQRLTMQRALESITRRAVHHPKSYGLAALLAGPPLALASFVMNSKERALASSGPVPQLCSSVCIELRVDDGVEKSNEDDATATSCRGGRAGPIDG
jgi:hypothetical protein